MLPQRSGDESHLVSALVTMLASARKGNVRSFVAIFRVEMPDGSMKWVKGWSKLSEEAGGDYHMLIGGLAHTMDRVVKQCDQEWEEFPS